MPDMPTAVFQVFPLVQVALRAQKQRQLQPHACQARQFCKLQKRHALGVFVLFISIHDPVR